MKIEVLKNTRMLTLEAESDRDLFHLGIIAGRFKSVERYGPTRESKGEIRVSFDTLLEALTERP